jgi:DNA-3-methyladenine glycosylase I
MDKIRCDWAGNDVLYQNYHDEEWGRPEHDEQKLFELLILEGFQAGLSWITILRKRADLRSCFADFDYLSLAEWSEEQLEACLSNPKIIRNRLKINAVKTNAQAFIKIQEKFGSFDHYIWSFVGYKSIKNHYKQNNELPAATELSMEISRSLKKAGFKFIGPTIVYAFMQASGMVNDHVKDCFCY